MRVLRICGLIALPFVLGAVVVSVIGGSAYLALYQGWAYDPFMAVMGSFIGFLICLGVASFLLEVVAKKDWLYRLNAEYEALNEALYRGFVGLLTALVLGPSRLLSLRIPEREGRPVTGGRSS